LDKIVTQKVQENDMVQEWDDKLLSGMNIQLHMMTNSDKGGGEESTMEFVSDTVHH
jgi:hypothetical protein